MHNTHTGAIRRLELKWNMEDALCSLIVASLQCWQNTDSKIAHVLVQTYQTIVLLELMLFME